MDFDDVAAAISVPRQAPADSFVLHAPLELMARVILLERVRPDGRAEAVERIDQLARAYQDAGDPVEPPLIKHGSPAELAAGLAAAIAAGELDDVDAYAAAFGERATPRQCRDLLAPAVVDSLAAAGHAPIFLNLVERAPWVSLIRGPARELARHPNWRIRRVTSDSRSDSRSLSAAFDAVPLLGLPGSDFIYPIVAQVDESGIAAKLLAGAHGPAHAITRAAAWSMLEEPPTYAPYGWTHCLTIPQAVLGLPVPGAMYVAATYVVAFRAALGTVPLRRTSPGATPDDVATPAALHEDAHYVKYTLACLDAASADPAAGSLYLAAAARLGEYWGTRP